MSELWYQTDLQDGFAEQTVWLDMRLREDQIISLKGEERKWRVKYQYPYPKTTENLERKRWNVGGIESETIR